MFKKIISYIIVAIIFIFFGLFISARNNKNIEGRIAELESISKSINDSDKEIKSGIDRLEYTINGIRETTSDIARRNIESEKRIERIEDGINKIERINTDSITTIGKLIIGNNESQGSVKQIESIGTEIGIIIKQIETRNKRTD